MYAIRGLAGRTRHPRPTTTSTIGRVRLHGAYGARGTRNRTRPAAAPVGAARGR
ncbi:hypothetical protein GCM10010274_40020 [Streptomyces lavendofoliae]|uniref:Uncharacterized protein n=1 Tax=Streptomyces lavendofoliae TaxID=67314 RepID=A0A918I0F6_9ACTN|nr:hypothetical protein GCM10010274_40020 [Streptomyces lavendofoliae]